MKKIRRLFSKKTGFTLVEMIVSVALLAILLGGMMLFITPIVRSFNDNQTDLTAENSAVCVQEYITRSIRNANQVAIFANTNYTNISTTSAYTEKIKAMNQFCTDVNGVGTADANKTYLLKCISLKYDDTDDRYYLYKETVNMNADGALTGVSTEVFSRCLFNDLYMTFELEKAENGDFPAVAGSTEFRDDAINITINAYRDAARNSLAFQGSGIFELRQIKVMLAAGGQPTDYNLTIYPTDQKSYAEMTAGSRDIYIYYIVRQLGTAP